MVTGKPFMAVRIPLKSSRWKGRSLARAFFRAFVLPERIISCMASMRPGPKNMCSVRVRPIPVAPKCRARRASSGVSAFARIPRVRCSSPHSITVPKYPESSGWEWGTSPSMTSPVEPSMEKMSSGPKLLPATVTFFCLALMVSSPAPDHTALPPAPGHHGGM